MAAITGTALAQPRQALFVEVLSETDLLLGELHVTEGISSNIRARIVGNSPVSTKEGYPLTGECCEDTLANSLTARLKEALQAQRAIRANLDAIASELP